MQTHVTAFRSEALVTPHRLGSDMVVVDVLPTRTEIASRDAALTEVLLQKSLPH